MTPQEYLRLASKNLAKAERLLRKRDFVNLADEIKLIRKELDAFGKPGGIVDQVQSAKDWPADVETAGGRFKRKAEKEK